MKKCGFEQREKIGNNYWSDLLWKKVGKDSEANMIVMQIRQKWGVE